MQISISIEPFLVFDMSLLTQYIENIIQIAQSEPDLSLHFDYFKPNQPVVDLLAKYHDQIAIYAHVMGQNLPEQNFKVISRDVTEIGVSTLTANQGLVFDLGAAVTGYEHLIKQAKYVTVMTVKCGKSGQTFQPEALSLIPKIRAINPDVIITVDGGVNPENINLLKAAGVDIAVVGNYAKNSYFDGNFSQNINRLLRI